METVMPLDEFTEAYIECALWSTTDDSTPEGGEPFDKNYDASHLADETLLRIIEDCRCFQRDNAAHIDGDDVRAGHDFWLTRNGHGAGFWDGDWSHEAGAALTAASKAWGSFDLMLGDDGKIHGS